MFEKATAAAFLWTIISAKPTCDQFDDDGNMLLSECLTEGQTPELAIAIGVALVLLAIIGAGVYFMCLKKSEDTADATEEDMEYSTLARNEVKATAGTIVEQTV